MSDVSQNPSFQLSKPPQKVVPSTNKHVVLKNKPTKRSGKSRNKNNNNNMMMNSNDNTTTTNSSSSSKPLKVVHISNPMRFQATAAEFRALVQGLTGRDAVIEWPEEPNYDTHHHHHYAADSGGSGGVVSVGGGSGTGSGGDEVAHEVHQHDQEEVSFSSCFGPSDLSYDYFGSSFHGDVINDDNHMVIKEDFRAFVGGYDDQ